MHNLLLRQLFFFSIPVYTHPFPAVNEKPNIVFAFVHFFSRSISLLCFIFPELLPSSPFGNIQRGKSEFLLRQSLAEQGVFYVHCGRTEDTRVENLKILKRQEGGRRNGGKKAGAIADIAALLLLRTKKEREKTPLLASLFYHPAAKKRSSSLLYSFCMYVVVERSKERSPHRASGERRRGTR